MLNIKQIKEALKTASLSTCAKETGIHYQQVWRIASGIDTNPQYRTLEKLSDWVEAQGDIQQ
jgi:transcriptional regulator with XRE-family HTH domain